MPWGSVLRRFLVVALCATTMLMLAAPRFAASAAEDAKAQADALVASSRELVQQQDFAGARSLLEQALPAYRQLGLGNYEAATLHELGSALFKQSDWRGAQERFEQELALYAKLGMQDGVEAARAHCVLGCTAKELRQYGQAQGHIEQALAVIKQTAPEQDMVSPLDLLHRILHDKGELRAAQAPLEQALAICQKLGIAQREAYVLLRLGELTANLGETEKAVGCYERAAAICRELGDRQGAVEALLGALRAPRILGATSQDGRANGYLEQLMAVCHEPEPGKERIELLRHAGKMLFEFGLYQPAQKCVDEELAAEGKPAAGGPGSVEAARARLEHDLATYGQSGREKERASTLRELAKVSVDLAQYGKALGCYGQALAIWRQLGLEKDEASTLDGLGKLSVELAQYDKALGYYGQALAIWRRLGLRQEEAGALSELGDLAALLAQYGNATDLYQQSLAIRKELGLEQSQAECLGSLGGVALAVGQYDAAAGHLEAALALQRKLGLEKEQAQTLTGLGNVASARDHLDQAMGYYSEALALDGKLGYDEGAGLVQFWMGESLNWPRTGYAARHFGEASYYYYRALAAHRAAGRTRDEARLLTLMGATARCVPERYDEAVDCLTQARAIWTKLGLEREEAFTLEHLAEATCMMTGFREGWAEQPGNRERWAKAIGLYEQSLAVWRKLGLQREEAYALGQLGWWTGTLSDARRDQAQSEKSMAYSEQALALWRRLGMADAEADHLWRLGERARVLSSFYGLPRYDQAASYYEQSLAMARRLGLQRFVAWPITGLAIVAAARGEYGKAISYYEQALAIYQNQNLSSTLRAGALRSLGDMARALGQYDRAASYYEQTLAIWRDGRNRADEAKLLGYLGRAAHSAGDYEKALAYQERALAVFQEMSIQDDTDRARRDIALVLMDLGRMPQARAQLEKLANCKAPLAWGRYHLLAGQPAKALAEFGQPPKTNSLQCETLVSIGTGLAEEGLQHWDRAAEAYARAVELTERARAATPVSERGRFFEARDLGFRRLEAYEGLVRVLHRLGREDEAFYWSEYTRARVLVEAVARAPFGASLGLPEELRKQEDGLSNRIAALSKRLEAEPEDRQASFQLQLAQAEREQLVATMRRDCPEYASMQYPEPLRPDGLSLGPKEVLLAFKVTEPETLLFLVRRGRVARVWEIKLSRQELASLVWQYRAAFGAVRQQADLRAMDLNLGERLYQLLLAPALAEVKPDEQVVVVPDEALELLPLEALVASAPQQVAWKEGKHGPYPDGVRYVGDARAFTYWQSGTAMTTTRRLRKEVGGDGALVIADPIFAADDVRARGLAVAQLPEAESQTRGDQPAGRLAGTWESLRSAYGDGVFRRLAKSGEVVAALRPLYGGRLRALVGLEASEGRLKREPLDGYGVVVFATHGVLDANAPGLRQPALLLSQVGNEPGEDGYLTMTEVMQLKLRAEVVALMACDTGTGKMVGGEGVMAMGRAFQYAGARSVLSSLWKAEDASTNLLTEVFLEHLSKGSDKLAALQAARRRLREAGYEHPFYWAGFVLIGESTMVGPALGQGGNLR